jgi:phosphatidyl-myo-inositol alpha-mannosyltransferase
MPYSPLLAGRIVKVAPKATAVVGTFHILPQTNFVTFANRLLAIASRRSLKRFDRVFAVSSAARHFAKQIYKIESTVLPNVVDVQRFRRAEPLPQYNDDKLTVVFLGRLVPRKGCMTLLEAANILKQRNHLPPFRIVVCGKGPLDAELKQYAADQLLEGIVTFTGFVPEDEKPRYVASADIMTFPSNGGESFGIVLVEALSSGRAVVLAGDNPGYHSVLAPKPELLFPPDQPFELANKLTTYLRDEKARKEMLAWGNAYVDQFDIATVGNRLVGTYREVLQNKR